LVTSATAGKREKKKVGRGPGKPKRQLEKEEPEDVFQPYAVTGKGPERNHRYSEKGAKRKKNFKPKSTRTGAGIGIASDFLQGEVHSGCRDFAWKAFEKEGSHGPPFGGGYRRLGEGGIKRGRT